jgi:hypothetical protein
VSEYVDCLGMDELAQLLGEGSPSASMRIAALLP